MSASTTAGLAPEADASASSGTVPVAEPSESTWVEVLVGKPIMLVTVLAVIGGTMAVVNHETSIILAAMAVTTAILGTIAVRLAADRAGCLAVWSKRPWRLR
jgi:hypothetical protein